MATRMVLGAEAKAWNRADKWKALSGFLRQHGKEALAFATLQDGMEYFIHDELGYLAFTSVTHPVFARKTKRIILSDPICAPENVSRLVGAFLEISPSAVFVVVSEQCAAEL